MTSIVIQVVQQMQKTQNDMSYVNRIKYNIRFSPGWCGSVD